MDQMIADLASTVCRNGEEGLTATVMPNVGLYKVSACIDLQPEIYQPVVSLILQGEKRLLVGDEVFVYRAGQTFTSAFDLPVLGRITEASVARPYLAVRLAVAPEPVSDLALTMPDPARGPERKGFGVDPASTDLLDAWGRMLRLLDRPEDAPVMAPLLEREIVYRLLSGPQGAVLRQVAAIDPEVSPIRKALTLIGDNYAGLFRVEDISRSVGMSCSAFHRRFKATTGMAPLQYQKTLRLYEARRLLLTDTTSVGAAAFAVGYQSVSQFSREYSRMFGLPPGRDIQVSRSALSRRSR